MNDQNNSIKVLSLVSTSNKDGSTLSFLTTILGLKDHGFRFLVGVPQEGFLTESLKKNGIEYFKYPASFWQKPMLSNFKDVIKYLPRFIRTIIQEIVGRHIIKNKVLEWKPDIIHTNVSVIESGFEIAKSFNIPHIWHIREYGDLDFNIIPLFGKKRHLVKLKNSYSICITKDLKKYFELGNQAKVIYNPISFSESSLKNLRKEKKIIFVGRLSSNKGTTEVVEAFIKYSKIYLTNDYKLELIGKCDDPKYREFLINKIKNNSLEEKIIFVGEVSNVDQYMRKALAIIVGSKNEGFGRITAEAMINQCLVIGKNTSGTKEQFDNGFSIIGKEIGIRYKDENQLVKAIREVTTMDASVYEGIIQSAAYTVKELYSPSENIQKTGDFFKQSIKKNSFPSF